MAKQLTRIADAAATAASAAQQGSTGPKVVAGPGRAKPGAGGDKQVGVLQGVVVCSACLLGNGVSVVSAKVHCDPLA